MDFDEILMASRPRLAEHTLQRRTHCDDGDQRYSILKWRYRTSEPVGVGSSRLQFAIRERKGRQRPMRLEFNAHAQGTFFLHVVQISRQSLKVFGDTKALKMSVLSPEENTDLVQASLLLIGRVK